MSLAQQSTLQLVADFAAAVASDLVAGLAVGLAAEPAWVHHQVISDLGFANPQDASLDHNTTFLPLLLVERSREPQMNFRSDQSCWACSVLMNPAEGVAGHSHSDTSDWVRRT